MVRELLDRGADIHARGDEALFYAAHYNDLFVIQELLSRGADINRLSPTLREQYRHLVPKAIDPQKYYHLELLVEGVQEYPDRYILKVNNQSYILNK